MKRKNRTSGKAGSSKERSEKSTTGKREKHPFQKFVKDKPDREKTRRSKPAFSKESSEGGRPSRSGFVKSEERRKPGSREGRNTTDKTFGSSGKRTSSGSKRFKPASRENSEFPKRGNEIKKRYEDKPYRSSEERSRGESEKRSSGSGDESGFSKERSKEKRSFGDKPFRPGIRKRTGQSRSAGENAGTGFKRRSSTREKSGRDQGELSEKRLKHDDFAEGRGFKKREDSKPYDKKSKAQPKSDDGLIRLNKYLSNAGVASRRDADDLIISGAVKVNGLVVTQLGTKIKPGDKVTYGDQAVQGERKVYLLLNKPKDYITTMDDPRDRKTVMHLIEGACRERVYPVGRLDRNTTGLLLLTNDGELAAKLTHPKYGVKKVYHASINKGLKPEHFQQLTEGIELEDGMVKVDDIAFVGEGKKEIGLELHSGKNRVVRRIFEQLGYDVLKLDRVVFAGLTKKDLPRGKYRFLSPKEVSFLKMIG